ncbi:hypothetical protein [Jannaschia sp. 2305UL9-9]|uniref:hypothetical protein n=1 Tax=Jannaschia sp. 2305UL9-9 TaxID=3121638 RepID=UPI003529C891
MTKFVNSALLVAALSVSVTAGLVPAVSAAESADASSATATQLITTKSDRSTHGSKAQMILASIAAESDN